jgi:hypothetical protein
VLVDTYDCVTRSARAVVGTVLALVRPPKEHESGDLDRPPMARSVVMIAVGSIAAIWGIASLVS